MTARLLAFDTSTEQLAIAVAGPAGEQLLLEAGGALASAALLPRIRIPIALPQLLSIRVAQPVPRDRARVRRSLRVRTTPDSKPCPRVVPRVRVVLALAARR